MGDDQRRAAALQPCERRLDQPLGLGVERRRRLVEQQHRRVAQHGAGDRDALALAARNLDAARADRGVVALRQAHDEVVRAGVARGGLDRLACGVRRAIGDVVGDARAEDERVLRHERDFGPQVPWIELGDVDPVERDRAA